MRKLKAFIISIIIVALLGVSAYAGLNYVKKLNENEVIVVSVGSIASDYYTQDTSLDGYITSNVSQTVYQDSDMIVDKVHVSAGDSVKKGDLLVSFDMTLVEMELNIARLRMQKLEMDLSAAEKRLHSLKNGGPIIESDFYGEDDWGDEDFGETEDLASIDRTSGYYLAVILPSFITSVFGDGTEVEEDEFENINGIETEDGSVSDGIPGDVSGDISDDMPGDTSGDDFGSGVLDPPAPTATPIPTQPPFAGEGVDLFVPGFTDGILGFSDGVEIFYEVLNEESSPITGSGTKEDPYVFLCSSANGRVIATGGFLNKMAGYSIDGKEIVKDGGYWYQLEFHQGNTVPDYNDRKASCTGYFLVDGCLLSSPVNMEAEMDFDLSEASTYEPQITVTPDYPYGEGNGNPSPTISRADAIKSQETIIAGLKLNIAELSLNISKLEKKVNKKEVFSKIDGVVADLSSDSSVNADGAELLKIESDQGYFVTGTVSELLLDRMKEGLTLNCMSYETGEFEAVVTDVSEYPVSGNNYWGSGNPNVSYYTFSAEIPEQSLNHYNGEWINITMPIESESGNNLVISKAFVRSENGTSYVYKEVEGVLKKQVLAVGGNVDGGYSVLVTGGLSRNDKIAFPYGDSVFDGAKTREGTLDELYGY